MVVRRLARDLDIPVRIEGVATVREADGLALSSRNAYLSPDERRSRAASLPGAARHRRRARASIPTPSPPPSSAASPRLRAGGFAVDYLELRDAATLAPMPRLAGPARLLAAVHLGRTRLIDNVPVAPG